MWIVSTIIIIVSLVYIYKKREEDEEHIGLKVIGYYILGSFKFTFNGFPIPLGFIIYILGFKPNVNKNTKKMAACFGLVMFCISSIFPTMQKSIFDMPRHVAISSNNIKSINLQEDLNAIRDKLNLEGSLDIAHFTICSSYNNLIDNVQFTLLDTNSSPSVAYNITYFKDTNKNKYTITKTKIDNSLPTDGFFDTLTMDSFLDADYFFSKIDLINNENSKGNYSQYYIELFDKGSNYEAKNVKGILIDKNNNLKEFTENDSPVYGALVNYHSIPIQTDGSSSPLNEFSYIIEN